MDSASQTSSADDNITICSSLSDITFSDANGCYAKDLMEKLMVQLKEKDEQLEKNKQEITELLANMELEKTRAIEAATNNLNTELASAQQANLTLKMTLWKSLPSADLCYYIKVPSAAGGAYDGYVYQQQKSTYYLLFSAGDLATSSLYDHARFKLTKNSDGTFSIYSKWKQCLQVETDSYHSATSFIFSSPTNNTNPSKFVLHYNHQQSKEPGILVDIFSLANGLFLSVGNKQNRVVANSHTAPAKKFLLLPNE